jgi:8-oxo-dGTP diphosphatase
MKLLKIINPENVSEGKVNAYPVREAVRAIVVDNEGKVALLHVKKENYYKLPGGGIEESEDKMVALHRECLEEIGCNVEVMSEVGMIVEYRKMYSLKQISYCYLVKVEGEKGDSSFTEEELGREFEQVWLPYEKAADVLSENNATSPEGRDYIVPRDITFLKAVKAEMIKFGVIHV